MDIIEPWMAPFLNLMKGGDNKLEGYPGGIPSSGMKTDVPQDAPAQRASGGTQLDMNTPGMYPTFPEEKKPNYGGPGIPGPKQTPGRGIRTDGTPV